MIFFNEIRRSFLAIYWGLRVQNFVQIRTGLTHWLYDV